jgi:uncharacterized membrane protein (DUF373 family)
MSASMHAIAQPLLLDVIVAVFMIDPAVSVADPMQAWEGRTGYALRTTSAVSPRRRVEAEERAIQTLAWTERIIFCVIGVLLFLGAVALLAHAALHLIPLFQASDVIDETTTFLDLILLTLMLVELAYTVMLSLRGAMLAAEPFLIVALIAVIRRVLVITVGHVQNGGTSSTQSLIELAVLTGVVIAFVFSIFILRSRPTSGLDLKVYDRDDP